MHSETFGEHIRKLRIARDMSLRELASALNYDQSSLSKIERNELVAPARLVAPMAKKLGADYKLLATKYFSEQVFYLLKDADYPFEALAIAKRRLEKEGKGTVKDLQRTKLLETINEYLSKQPIEKAWVFGSFARNEQSRDSDIDILVRFTRPNKLDLLDYVGMKQELEQLAGRQVDLVEEGYLLPRAKQRIEQEKVLIYERKAG
jgi:predicted nucleotidyltransferase/DNA-binding XRE family transcriptional regulator